MKKWKLLTIILVGISLGFFYVYLGIGVPKVPVPPLVGKEITAATKLLNSVGLNIKVVGEEESSTFPPNYVVSQKPLPGLSVKKGSVIEVVISGKGDMVLVPELVGRKLSEVNAFIKEAGLVIGDVISIRSLLGTENTVIGQSISPNRRVKRGSKIDLLVSLGYEAKTASVPDLVGLSLDEAKKVIQEKGFKLGKISEKVEAGEEGVVVTQDPSPFSSISLGGEINLVVRKAPLKGAPEKPVETKPGPFLPGSSSETLPATSSLEKMELAVPKGARIIDFSFTVPSDKAERLVEIIQIDSGGQHVIFSKKCKAGEVITLRVPAVGDNVIRVQLDGEFYAEDRYPWKKE